MAVTPSLPFSSRTLGGTSVTSAQMVFGSGSLTKTPNDTSVTTADNKIHNVRISNSYEASFDMFGDHRSLETDPGLPVACTILGETFYGHVTCEYDDSAKTTAVSVVGNNTMST